MSNKKRQFRGKKPQKQKNIIATKNIEVIDTGLKGDGVGFYQKQPVYINRSIAGDYVNVRIEKTRDGTLRGCVEDITTPSPNRQEPPCPHYDECGGCSLQHMKKGHYKEWKTDLLAQALERRGLNSKEFKNTEFIPEHTRRRATFSAYKQNNKTIIGYHKRRSKNITNITECLVSHTKILELKDKIKESIHSLIKDSKPCDIFIQLIDDQIDLLITGPLETRTQKPELATLETVAEMAQTYGISRISWRMKDKDAPELLIEQNPLLKRCGELSVALPIAAFLQPSAEGEAYLAKTVMENLPKSGPYADLFSGTGTFAGHMIQNGHVDAYDSEGDAINRLSDAAKTTSKLKAYERNLFTDPLTAKELNKYKAIVLDPPRAGAKEQAEEIAKADIDKIIYISCNPATFARDAEIIMSEGTYNFTSAQVVDQFIWSHHIEVIGIFEKK